MEATLKLNKASRTGVDAGRIKLPSAALREKALPDGDPSAGLVGPAGHNGLMTLPPSRLARRCLASGEPFTVIAIASAEGSAPREAGAAMVVSAQAVAGTIGGGRLEWDAIAAARDMLKKAGKTRTNNETLYHVVSLGPDIGQCCGGRVRLAMTPGGLAETEALETMERAALEARPSVLIYGAGHVGRALAAALAPLPLKVSLADAREEELAAVADGRIERVRSDKLSDLAAAAPAGAAHAVMTHSHALDSLIAAAVLEQGRHAYLGLIGSRTKKALFFRAFRELGLPEAAIAQVACPIGGGAVRDKRPEVIAALAAAEIVTALLGGVGG